MSVGSMDVPKRLQDKEDGPDGNITEIDKKDVGCVWKGLTAGA